MFNFHGGCNQTILILLVVIYLIFGRLLVFGLKKCKIISSHHKWDQDLDVNENLPDYFCCIPGEEQKNWYAKEVYLREVLELKTIDDKELERLRTAQR